MSYTKQNWQTGDIITAEKLNHMEDGIAGGYDIVFTKDLNGFTADGASLEELASGGYKNALLHDRAYSVSVGFMVIPMDDLTHVHFTFIGDPVTIFRIGSDGTFAYNTMNGTYTYSNGHYVFTPGDDTQPA